MWPDGLDQAVMLNPNQNPAKYGQVTSRIVLLSLKSVILLPQQK